MRLERDLQDRIKDLLSRFINKKFNDVQITKVVSEYDGQHSKRRADIAVLVNGDLPLLLIETKLKREGLKLQYARRFHVMFPEVLGQVFSYAAILRKKGVNVPFVATANESQIAVFTVPEDIAEKVDWEAIKNRDYENVLSPGYIYDLRNNNLIMHTKIKFTEEFFTDLLNKLTGFYAKKYEKYGLEKIRQELSEVIIEDFRGFVTTLAPFIQDAIAPSGNYRYDWNKKIEEYSEKKGYSPTPEQLSMEMAYVLLNKIVFYKVLERHYRLPKLEPMYTKNKVKTVNEYLKRLREFFEEAIKTTGDFEAIFETGIYDDVEVVESEDVLKLLDWLVDLIDHYSIEKLGDIIGYIYEELIPAEDRHQFGQFYTPPAIAELIVKWAVRSPDDKVLDPGCGSGTFLVEAYKRLAELKLNRPFGEVRYVPSDVHSQILGQLHGIDINEFPAHLTAMNLAMRNPKVPSTNINVVVEDYFKIMPGQERLMPYKVRSPRGVEQGRIMFKDFDAVVGNPPYTRWTEISDPTQDQILRLYREVLGKYGLTPQVARGVEPGIYVYWIMHSTGFLKNGGRLGMIISDSWLQALYGIDFLRFLADNYRIRAIIDIETRVFPVPLIGACMVLLEKEPREEERRKNNVVFMLLRPKKTIDVDSILKLVDEYSTKPGAELVKDEVVLRVVPQEAVYSLEGKPITLLYNPDIILKKMRESGLAVKLSKYFEPSRGNTVWSTWALKHGKRPDSGGDKFFYLSEDRARQLGIPKECLYPLLPSPRYAKFFTFTEEDWKAICKGGGGCWLFLCHKPRNQLPESVKKYIEMGEGPNAVIRLRKRPGEAEGRPVSESMASRTRKRHGDLFYGWYDLGGVVNAPIYATYNAQYWLRFMLSKFSCALDHGVLALIPKRGVQLSEEELKALLAYLNSSFSQLQAEVRSVSTGGGMIVLDVKPLSEFFILDVKKLDRDVVERLAQLFDKLESEARRLDGAGYAENVFGSELTKELTSKSDIQEGVDGLFNTVIREIDYEVGRILGFDKAEVELTRSLVLDLVKRRLSRAGEAKPGAVKRSTTPPAKGGGGGGKRRKRGSGGTVPITKFFGG